MTEPAKRKEPVGAGSLIALAIMVGTIGGGLMGQPSAGLLVGVAVGVLIALLLWWRDSRR
jgi:hypothetical protein